MKVLNSRIDGAMTIGGMREMLAAVYGELLKQDWSTPQANARLWYYSAEKLEPRLGRRQEEPLDAYEQPLAPARDAAMMAQDLATHDAEMRLAEFLLKHPPSSPCRQTCTARIKASLCRNPRQHHFGDHASR
ncbi:MAG: hypothetical protein R3D29_09085 [Nitratireductor sp.]